VEYGPFFQLPRAPSQDSAARYAETIEQIVLADQLGFDAAWLAEMHFVPAYSIMPSPLIVGAAAAARTRRIRIGIAVALLPLHHPIRAAEDAATLDILSGGRLEYGIGRGSISAHFDGFGIPMRERGTRFDEAIDIIRMAWGPAPVTYEGQHFRYHHVNVEPKPLQRPHPRIRLAANSDESTDRAIREGWSIMVSPVTAFQGDLRRRLNAYRAGREANGQPVPPGDIVWLMPVHVAEDGDRAREEARHSLETYFSVVAEASAAGFLKAGGDPENLPPVIQRFRNATYDDILRDMAAIGSPAEVHDKLDAIHHEFGAGHFQTWFNAGGLIPHDLVQRSMQLFSDKVRQ
jgi:alkanesulfonate monooxygenase SsuD/methylene tetrahydromethanopterin reductase-like flavin-dependent oxidoreductase (luciferase family)